MAKEKDKKKFNVGEPIEQVSKIDNSKYKIGLSGISFHEIRSLKPVFAFDYLSLNQSEMCFDNAKLETADYLGFLQGLKAISDTTYHTLHDTKQYRFHKIDFSDRGVSISRKQFKMQLTHKEELLSDDDLPNLYQFDLNYIQKARAAGFLFKGVFYLVWFDRDHLIYS